jgi:hypothetical protein
MPREPKSRDELAKGFFNMYKVGAQWKAKLAADEITENELWEMAYAKADERIEKRMEVLQGQHAANVDWTKQDQVYLEEREEQYRRDYDWSIRSDEKILENILTTEVSIRRVERVLQDIRLTPKERNDTLNSLMALLKVHKELLSAAGIDRLSREKKRAGADPIEDWERIKELAREKMRLLQEEFTSKTQKVTSEAELRDRMKFHLGYPFEIIDAALSAHRRVLGLPENVEVS